MYFPLKANNGYVHMGINTSPVHFYGFPTSHPLTISWLICEGMV